MEVVYYFTLLLDTFLFFNPEIFFGKLLKPVTQEVACILENYELEKNSCEIWGKVST